jgi:hypothetical protein
MVPLPKLVLQVAIRVKLVNMLKQVLPLACHVLSENTLVMEPDPVQVAVLVAMLVLQEWLLVLDVLLVPFPEQVHLYVLNVLLVNTNRPLESLLA